MPRNDVPEHRAGTDAADQLWGMLEALTKLWGARPRALDPSKDLNSALRRTVLMIEAAFRSGFVLVGAYYYVLSRCLKAGKSPEEANAAWQAHSSEALLQALIDTVSLGADTGRARVCTLLDAAILAKMGVPPGPPDEERRER